MKKIATNLESFVSKIEGIERQALNEHPEIGKALLVEMLKENPGLTQDEWKETKSNFMTFIFCKMMQESPELMEELARHVYNRMQQE